MNLDCKIRQSSTYSPPTSGWGYYVQRWGTRDKLKALTKEAAIAEAKEMPGAEAVVLVTMETVWTRKENGRRPTTRKARGVQSLSEPPLKPKL